MISNFGQLVGQLRTLLSSQNDQLDDLHAYHAPGECYDLVIKRHEREIDELLERWNLTRAEYNRELTERTTPFWAYKLGLLDYEGEAL